MKKLDIDKLKKLVKKNGLKLDAKGVHDVSGALRLLCGCSGKACRGMTCKSDMCAGKGYD